MDDKTKEVEKLKKDVAKFFKIEEEDVDLYMEAIVKTIALTVDLIKHIEKKAEKKIKKTFKNHLTNGFLFRIL